MAHTAVELHGCCARVSLAEALLCQHTGIDGVARASSAGTKIERVERAPRSLLVLHTMLAPVVENRTVGGSARGTTLGLDDEANSQTADGGATARAAAFRVGGTSVGDLPTRSTSS